MRNGVIICKVLLLELFHGLNYKIMKVQRFEIHILLPSSGQKEERLQKAYLLERLIVLALDWGWVCRVEGFMT